MQSDGRCEGQDAVLVVQVAGVCLDLADLSKGVVAEVAAAAAAAAAAPWPFLLSRSDLLLLLLLLPRCRVKRSSAAVAPSSVLELRTVKMCFDESAVPRA